MPTLPDHEKQAFHIAIRITKDPTNPEYAVFFKRHFTSVIACLEEHATRPHIHVVAEIGAVRSVALSRMLKKLFGFSGNTDFSVKNVTPTVDDFQEVVEYACKGESPKCDARVTFRTDDYPDVRVKFLHDEYWRKHPVEEKRSNNCDDPVQIVTLNIPRKKTQSWTEKWLEKLDNDYPDHEWDWTTPHDRQIVMKHLLKNLGETKKQFNEFKLKEWVYAAFNYFDATGFRSDVIDRLNKLLAT